METLDYRRAIADDYDAISRLITTPQELFRVYPAGHFPFSREQVNQLALVRMELSVATVASKVVAFGNLYGYEPNRHIFIGNLIIDRVYRGNGIGQGMMRYLLKQVFYKYRLMEARISVFSDNIPALLLYTKLGFEPYRVEPRKNFEKQRVALLHMKMDRERYSDMLLMDGRSATGNEQLASVKVN